MVQKAVFSFRPAIQRAEVQMITFSVSYVMKVLRAPTMPAGFLDKIALRWRKLLDPYRPELYYMRGPGPKCRQSLPRLGEELHLPT